MHSIEQEQKRLFTLEGTRTKEQTTHFDFESLKTR